MLVCLFLLFSQARCFHRGFPHLKETQNNLVSFKYRFRFVGNAREIPRKFLGANFGEGKENPDVMRSIESVLSANKKLNRTAFRRIWTFVIAPALTVAGLSGTASAIALNLFDGEKAVPAVVEWLLAIAQGAMILHVLCGGICFGIAKKNQLKSPISFAGRGFVSGYIVIADLLEDDPASGKQIK